MDIAQVRRLALALPEATDDGDETRLAFSVGGKGFSWSYMVRPAPKKTRVPDLTVLAVRCRPESKEILLEAAPDRFFDDDHYRGYPAILVRRAAIEAGELGSLLAEAWRLMAPKCLKSESPA